MSKFSISTILWLVTLFAIGLAIVTTRNILLEKTLELEAANSQIAKLRDDLGLIEVTDSNKCHIRSFRDRYSDDISHWRLYFPDASKCQICYAYGELPEDGIPVKEDGRPLQDKLVPDHGLPQGAADLVVTIEVDMHSRSFCIRLRPEYRDGTFSGGNNIFKGLGDWWPQWWNPNLQWIRDGVPTDRTTQFNFNEPFVFVKRAVRNDEGKLEGYMFWVENFASSVSNRN